jgi:hypothetical protein
MKPATDRPRDPKNIVLEAELMSGSPERVRSWLEATAADQATHWANDEVIERALLARNDALINLSLARFSTNNGILQEIFTGPGKENLALRLATLQNEAAARRSFIDMPLSLVDRHDQLPAVLSAFCEEELTALFSNPTLGDNFLIDFFEQKAPWQALDESRQLAACRALYKNPRMQSRYSGPMDGYAEYLHDHVFDSAWAIAEKLPVKAAWASTLCWLYEKLPPRSSSVKDPLRGDLKKGAIMYVKVRRSFPSVRSSLHLPAILGEVQVAGITANPIQQLTRRLKTAMKVPHNLLILIHRRRRLQDTPAILSQLLPCARFGVGL